MPAPRTPKPRPRARPKAKKRDPFVEGLVAALTPLGPIHARAMFGGWGVYLDGLCFGLRHLKPRAERNGALNGRDGSDIVDAGEIGLSVEREGEEQGAHSVQSPDHQASRRCWSCRSVAA